MQTRLVNRDSKVLLRDFDTDQPRRNSWRRQRTRWNPIRPLQQWPGPSGQPLWRTKHKCCVRKKSACNFCICSKLQMQRGRYRGSESMQPHSWGQTWRDEIRRKTTVMTDWHYQRLYRKSTGRVLAVTWVGYRGERECSCRPSPPRFSEVTMERQNSTGLMMRDGQTSQRRKISNNSSVVNLNQMVTNKTGLCLNHSDKSDYEKNIQ